MSIASLVASAASELEAILLSDRCTITPILADGSDGTPATVRCAVVEPTAGQGPGGGGGNSFSRPVDKTILLPRTTVVASGYRINRVGTTEAYSVGHIVAPRSHDPLLHAQCVAVRS